MGPAAPVAEVRRAVRQLLAEVGGPVLVACSGGADSVALAAATAFEARKVGVSAGLITIDHGLQNGSEERAAEVAQLAYELGFDPVEIVPVTVGTDGGPEAAARSARYAALDAAANAHNARVLLGHTLDDQAESVLLGLGRGSGARSLAGMRTWHGHYLRPFLGVRRSTTRAACEALGLPVWDDPHNLDPSFQRVRLRTEVLPLLEDVLQGGVAEALARTADLLRDDADVLDELAAVALTTSVDELRDLPPAVRSRVLRSWAQLIGAGPLSAEHTASLDALVTDWHGQGPIQLPGGVEVVRTSGRLEVHTPPSGS